VDECHHVPAVSFERVLSNVNAKYRSDRYAPTARWASPDREAKPRSVHLRTTNREANRPKLHLDEVGDARGERRRQISWSGWSLVGLENATVNVPEDVIPPELIEIFLRPWCRVAAAVQGAVGCRGLPLESGESEPTGI
ncbi:MAG TPA: hypothetical protein VLU24_06700, partial [Mycobacterium sp.]|nr:hypothetical protein [Mycobacterium sp.]